MRRSMPVDFQQRRFTFPSRTGFAQTQDQVYDFPSNIRPGKAVAMVNGFSMGFTASEHPVFRQEVETSVVQIFEDTVRVRVTFALRDRSGFFDDAYDGFVDVVVVVDRV
jgi:hypothetical protein